MTKENMVMVMVMMRTVMMKYLLSMPENKGNIYPTGLL